MTDIFLKLANMSITAGWIILAVAVLRLIFKKMPKWCTCLLWGIAGLRLIFPFSFESVLSLIPSSEPIPQNIAISQAPAIDSGITLINQAVNPVISDTFAPEPASSINPMQILLQVAAIIWLIGIAVLLGYSIASYVRLHKKVKVSLPYNGNIYYCDSIDTPFILGVFRPRIYLPSAISEEEINYVIEHEKAHIKRKDNLWKPLGFILLSVYWFNPMVWLAYILFCRDIEKACDEKVVKDMDSAYKKGYSNALLNCSARQRAITACPLAFGEVGVKNRIKSVLNYKKPKLWIVLAALIVSIAVAVCFLTNPINSKALYVSIQESSSMLDGFSIEITDIKTDGDSPYINIKWKNETEHEAIFGEEFYLYRYDNGKWMDTRKAPDDYAWNDEGFLVFANDTAEHQYSLYGINLTDEGKYRFETDFGVDSDNTEYKIWIEFELTGEPFNSLETTTNDKTTQPTDYTAESSESEEPTTEDNEPTVPDTTSKPQESTTKKVPDMEQPDKAVYETAVAYANSASNDKIYTSALNSNKVSLNHQQNLPIFKFESMDELKAFKTDFADIINYNGIYNEATSANELLASYDEEFFENNVLFAVYVVSPSGSYRYGVDSIYIDSYSFVVNIKQLNNPQIATTDELCWIITVEADKNTVKTCTEFNAYLINNKKYEIAEIIDRTKTEDIITAAVISEFFEDNDYIYFYPSAKRQHIIVTFTDGTEMIAEDALKAGYISINDLDTWDIQYYKEKKN